VCTLFLVLPYFWMLPKWSQTLFTQWDLQ
jgi:hypothetical protein